VVAEDLRESVHVQYGVHMIAIRPETSADWPAIYDVNARAFGREGEARLVDAIRASASFLPELSLVAVDAACIVGHVLFSSIHIHTVERLVPVLALAPVAVLPERQNQGIGSALIRHGLEQCRRLGHGIVVVVGHPNYYPRFGFSSARAKGFDAPFPDAAFMVQELVPGALDGVCGTVEYPPAFVGM
jgi:putative acetyltransferase